MYRLVPPAEMLSIPFRYGHVTEAERAARRVYGKLEGEKLNAQWRKVFKNFMTR